MPSAYPLFDPPANLHTCFAPRLPLHGTKPRVLSNIADRDLSTIPDQDLCTIPDRDLCTIPDQDLSTIPDRDLYTILGREENKTSRVNRPCVPGLPTAEAAFLVAWPASCRCPAVQPTVP